MKCKYCGAEMNKDMRFCANCGKDNLIETANQDVKLEKEADAKAGTGEILST